MKNVLLLVNLKSRQAAGRLDDVMSLLNEAGLHVLNDVGSSEDFNSVITKNRERADLVVVCGGDGSVNTVLPSLLKARLPLLLIPLGTANNLARTLEIPSAREEILELLRDPRSIRIDIGFANDVPFVNLIGLGLSTQINRLVRSGTKRWLGVLAFFPTAFKVALRMTPFRAGIRCDGRVRFAYTWQITVCNGRNYGSGLTIDEDATLTDCTLHGLSTEVKRWWHAFFMVPAFWRGRFLERHRVYCFHGKNIRIETRRPMHVDVDGDIKTSTPVEIRVEPNWLEVLTPRGRPRATAEAVTREIQAPADL